MKINVRSNVDQVKRDMEKIAKKDIPRATRRAINTTADKANKAVIREIRYNTHNPTPFTKNKPTFVRYAKTSQSPQVAIVGVKDIQASYLQYVEYGGVSNASGKAKPVPTTKYKNTYGNIRGGRNAVKNMLSKSNKYFSGIPQGTSRPGGVYERSNGGLHLVASWQESTKHNKTASIGNRVNVIVDKNFERELRKQFRGFAR